MSVFIKDLLLQIDGLLWRFAELQSPTEHPAAATLQPAILARVQDLSADDVRTSLRRIRNTVVLLAREHLAVITHSLLRTAERHRPQTAGKVALPGKHDATETIDDFREDTVEYWILDTLKKLFDAAGPALSDVGGDKTLQFVQSKLHYSNSTAIRRAAAECCASLSRVYLKPLVEAFIAKLNQVQKSDEFREYVPFQRAVKLLDFGFRSPQQMQVTVWYFQELLKKLPKMDRGVMRREVCDSLGYIFTQLMVKPSPENAIAWQKLQEEPANGIMRAKWWEAYNQVYDIVLKWSKSSSHTLFCWSLLRLMQCAGNESFYDAHKLGSELLLKFTDGFRDKAMREQCLKLTRDFVRDTNIAFIRERNESFQTLMKSLLQALFKRKEVTTMEESPLFTEILVEISKKNFTFAVSHSMQLLQSSGGCTVEQKAAVLRAINHMCQNSASEIVPFNDMLTVHIITPILEGTPDALLLPDMLRCFPTIRPSNVKGVQQAVERIGKLTLHPDRDVCNAAINSLLDYMLQHPGSHLVSILTAMTKVLARASTDVLKTFNNAQLMLRAYCDNAGKGSAEVDVREWLELRPQLEGVCLIWLTHNETWVRNDAFRFLAILGAQPFRTLEKSVSDKPPFLADALIQRTGDASSPHKHTPFGSADTDMVVADVAWADELTEFLTNPVEPYSVCVSFAWHQLFAQLRSDDVSQLMPEDERVSEWKNMVKFCCMALRPGPPSAAREQDEFLRFLIPFIHSERLDIRDAVLAALQLLHQTSYADFLRHLKTSEQERDRLSKQVKGRRQDLQAQALPDYFTQEQVLLLYVNIIQRISPADDLKSVLGAYYDLISVWISNLGIWAMQPPIVRAYASSIVQGYLKVTENSDDSLQRLTARELISLLSALASGSSDGSAEDIRRADVNVAAAGAALAQRGPLDDDIQVNDLLQFEVSLVQRGTHTAPAVESAICALLTHNPAVLPTCMSAAVFDDSGISMNMQALAMQKVAVYVAAIGRNFSDNLRTWLRDHEVPLAKLLVFSLFQQCSPIPAVRRHAVALANALANNDAILPPLSPGHYLLHAPHGQLDVYVEAATKYSAALAFKCPQLTAEVFDEALQLAQRNVPPDHRQMMIRVISPWVRNIGPLLQHKTAASTCPRALSALFDICALVIARPASLSVLESLWQDAIMSDAPPELLVPAIVKFLVQRMATAQEKGEVDPEVAVKFAARCIARTSLAAHVIAEMVKYLRCYDQPLPASAQDFVTMKGSIVSKAEPPKPLEQAAFVFLSDIVYEHDLELAIHLPAILQNAFVLFARSTVPLHTALAHMLMSNLLHSMTIRLAGSAKSRADAIDIRDRFFPDPYTKLEVMPSLRGLREFPPPCLMALVDSLSPQYPVLREKWGQVCLSWVLFSVDNELTLNALKLFRLLNEHYDLNLVSLLVALLFSAAQAQDDELVTELLSLFAEVSVNHNLTTPCWQLITGAAVSCLHTGTVDQFRLALRVLTTIYEDKKVDVQLLCKHDSVWAAAAPPHSKATLDTVIMHVLVKGITHQDTIDQTLWLMEQLAAGMVDRFPSNNSVAIGILLVYVVMIGLDLPGAAKRALKFTQINGYALDEINTVFVKHLQGRYSAHTAPEPITSNITGRFENVAVDKGADLAEKTSTSRFQPPKFDEMMKAKRDSDFLSDFFATYAPTFYSPENFDFSLQMMEMLLRRGINEWRLVVVQMYSYLLQNVSHMWDKEQYEHVSELVLDNCYSANPSIQEVSERTVAFLLEKAPTGASTAVFNFTRKLRTMRRRTVMHLQPDGVFPGMIENEVTACRSACLRAIGRAVLNIQVKDLEPIALPLLPLGTRHHDESEDESSDAADADVHTEPTDRPADNTSSGLDDTALDRSAVDLESSMQDSEPADRSSLDGPQTLSARGSAKPLPQPPLKSPTSVSKTHSLPSGEVSSEHDDGSDSDSAEGTVVINDGESDGAMSPTSLVIAPSPQPPAANLDEESF